MDRKPKESPNKLTVPYISIFTEIYYVIIMKILNIVIVMLVLIMSVGAVCAADDISDEIISDDGQDTL